MNNLKIKVGIIGLGLIGGSLLKKLSQNNNYEIYCYSNSSYKKALNYCLNASNNIKIIKDCDIIFVCSSITKTLETLEKLNIFLNPKQVVVDVCSIKKEILNKKYNFDFILSHPMSGTENSGFDASIDTLFQNNKWLVEKDNDILNKIINDVGSQKVKINMQEHDFMCAQISHLPAILSFLLFNSTNKNSKEIASSGFRDTTRLAMTNFELLNSMYELNQNNIEKALEIMLENLKNLKKLPLDERINLFKKVAIERKQMYDKFGKNIFKI